MLPANNLSTPMSPVKVLSHISHLVRQLRPQLWKEFTGGDASNREPSPTAWLNGIRGLAALAVFNYHWFFAFTSSTYWAYGLGNNYAIWSLPYVRLLYDGITAVCIFFTVAGYVVSARTLQLLSTNKQEQAIRGMTSSVFRRFFRLYLPAYFVMIVATILAYFGAFDFWLPMLKDKRRWFAREFIEMPLTRMPLTQQIRWLIADMAKITNPFFIPFVYSQTEAHLWTIPLEWRSSMLVYLAMLGTAYCTTYVRLGFLVLAAMLCQFYDHFEAHLYFCGAAMAQYNVLRSPDSTDAVPKIDPSSALGHGHTSGEGLHLPLPQQQASQQTSVLTRLYRHIFRPFMYLFALYLMSTPIRNFERPGPGFVWIGKFLAPRGYTRRDTMPKGNGITILLLLLFTSRNTISSQTPSIWHRLFTSRVALYFGRIMFGFYLVHGTVLHSFGYVIPYWTWQVIGLSNNFTWFVGFFIGWVICFIISVCLGDLFTREVEPRCVRLTSWIEKKCFQ